jgi:DNA-binding NtrC family response regulator
MLDCTALLVSPDEALIEAVERGTDAVEHLGLEVTRRPEEALDRLHRDDIALVLVHLGKDGEAGVRHFVAAVAALPRLRPVVVFGEARPAADCEPLLAAGASEYLELPVDGGRLACLLDALTVRARLGAPRPLAPEGDGRPPEREPCHFLIAAGMGELMEQVRRVGPQDTTVLLTGETGTGKTHLARLIHELSPRRAEPFLVADCGALSTGLIESEMFGHVRGAFTGADRDREGKFAAACGGTLLLDEVSSLPPHLQGKLLRAVDDRLFEPVGGNQALPLRARLLAASNIPLDHEVTGGRFRADLYYRLNVVCFYLPPLRERRCAIAPLAHRFLAEFAARAGRPPLRLGADALRTLEAYDWPGNIRELRNVIERAVALCDGEIHARELPEAVRTPAGRPTTPPSLARSGLTLMKIKEEAEILRITEALERHNNNRLRAAAELGISRMALYKKLHKYGLMDTA